MVLPDSDRYNYHSHTQFCDGRASMEEMAAAAFESGMEIWGFSPHSPISVESKCNMRHEQVKEYLNEASRMKDKYGKDMKILTGMEIDFISTDFGPHLDYFQNLPLDYRIGSVHFVPTQEGVPLDCDGRFERFAQYLKDGYRNDLRYVVEKFFEQELIMIERGGFDILGHFDKIAANASIADPSIENQGWYQSLIEDVIRSANYSGLIIEINTKSIFDKKRLFPAQKWWTLLLDTFNQQNPSQQLHKSILVNSDAHYPDKVNLGRNEAIEEFESLIDSYQH